jgi:flavin-dependent dehydrogenase
MQTLDVRNFFGDETMMQPIRILGAGPAGLAAAITLAHAGRQVIVYERGAGVGGQHSGDLEALDNFTTQYDVLTEWKQWGIETNFNATPILEGTWFGPQKHHRARVRDAEPIFYFVERGSHAGSLDAGLLAQAQAVGVCVEFNRHGTPSQVDIVASGLIRPSAYGVGYNFKTDAPNGAYVAYDDELTPGTYSYLGIAKGRGTLVACAMIPREGMRNVLPRVVKNFQARVTFEMRDAEYFAASIGLGLPTTALRDGKLYAGEAGNLQDIFAGFGIRMALTTGYLAAHSLIEQRPYDAMWRARYQGMIQTAAVNRWLQESFGNHAYPLLLQYLNFFPIQGAVFCADTIT